MAGANSALSMRVVSMSRMVIRRAISQSPKAFSSSSVGRSLTASRSGRQMVRPAGPPDGVGDGSAATTIAAVETTITVARVRPPKSERVIDLMSSPM